MKARVPASSANLGPGFDVLAVALSLYVTVDIEPAAEFSMHSTGCGAGTFDGENHLAVRIARDILGHSRFSLTIDSHIPAARGLGSSAAVAIAAAAAAASASPVDAGIEIDGHGENAVASAFGGLVAARVSPDLTWRHLPLDDRWRFVVAIPDQELSTDDARTALPATVPFADAVANIGGVALLIAGLARCESYVPRAMHDTMHQPYRSHLLPAASQLMATMVDAGAHDACWSGAGSTMLALTTEEGSATVAAAVQARMAELSVPGTVHILNADRDGIVMTPTVH